MANARYTPAVWSVLVFLIFAAETPFAEDTEIILGAKLLAPLKTDLKQALVAGLQHGPLAAITVCKDQAPAIAASLSVEGVEMGRASHRLRNPANVAPDWVSPILASYVSDGAEPAPRVVSLPDDREGYVEPIATQPICLACHGKNLAPDVAAHIRDAYPDDRATGFEAGDLPRRFLGGVSCGKVGAILSID